VSIHKQVILHPDPDYFGSFLPVWFVFRLFFSAAGQYSRCNSQNPII
jgi:hypothetical protein